MNEFSDEKLKELQEAFELYDGDKDNFLNFEETDSAFKCLGYDFDYDQLMIIFKEYGTNTSDPYNNINYKFNFNSFSNFLNKRCKEVDAETELIHSFKQFDKDGDGRINVKEMKYLLLTLGERLEDEEVEEIIREVDTTGQGAITYNDFVKIMMLK